MVNIPIVSDIYELIKKGIFLILKQLFKPLFYQTHIKPLLKKIEDHITTKYGKNSFQINKYAIEIGNKELELERGKWRIYLPFNEMLFGLKENREFMLIQECIRNSFLPEIDNIDKEFKEAVCVNETNEFLENQKNGILKQRVYYNKVVGKNKENKNLDLVSEMEVERSLKPLLLKILKETKKAKQSGIIIRKSRYAKNKIKNYVREAKNKTKLNLINSEILDKLPNKNLIKNVSKDVFDYNRNYTTEQVIESIISGKKPKHNTGQVISYFLITELILNKPGLTVNKISQFLNRPPPVIKYGVIALLEHDKGLGLVERKKGGNHFLIYPSQKLKKMLSDRRYKFEQRELFEWS